MLDFRPKSNADKPVSLERGQKSQPFMKGRERLTVLMAIAVLILVVMIIAPFIAVQLAGGGDDTLVEDTGAPLKPAGMLFPDLTQAEALPDADAIAKVADRVNEYLAHPERLFGRVDAVIVGWAAAQLEKDESKPPLPSRLSPTDIAMATVDAQHRVRTGTPVVATGTLVGKELAGEWTRLLIETEPSQFFTVIARGAAAELPLSEEVNIVGRYLGLVSLPAVEGGVQNLITIASSRGTVITPTADISSTLGIGKKDAGGQSVWAQNPSIFDNVDDNSVRIEYRPYYYLLGHVLRDKTTPGVYDEALDGVRLEQTLHHAAPAHRGKAFTVKGKVLRAWEDYAVGQDKPFGVTRVFRIWMWAYVPVKEEIEMNGETRTITKSFPGAFELAVMVDDEAQLPEMNHEVTATGRFFKVQRYQVDRDFVFNRLSNPDRLSDSVYFKFFVANDYSSVAPPPPVDMYFFYLCYVILFLSLIVMMVWLISRERNKADDYKQPIRKMRKARRRLRNQAPNATKAGQPAEAESLAAAEGATEDEAHLEEAAPSLGEVSETAVDQDEDHDSSQSSDQAESDENDSPESKQESTS